MTKIKNGFSLIQLLVSLIIVSLALAAFAPVISKQVKSQGSSLASKLTKNCNITNCSLCYKHNVSGAIIESCVSCTNKCERGKHLDESNCECKSNDSTDFSVDNQVYDKNEDNHHSNFDNKNY